MKKHICAAQVAADGIYRQKYLQATCQEIEIKMWSWNKSTENCRDGIAPGH